MRSCWRGRAYMPGCIIHRIWGNITMKQEKIDRINELARKAKTDGLTVEEEAEREALRLEYKEAILGSLRDHLEHTWIVDEKGNKRKLQHKGEKAQ